jgi:hypothetical protein
LKERTGKGKGYAFVLQMCGKRLFHIVKAVQRSEGVCETGDRGKIRAGKRKHMKIPGFFLDGCFSFLSGIISPPKLILFP